MIRLLHYTLATISLTLCSGALLSAAQSSWLDISSGDKVNPVLELYTSEGCSSCPPADRWLSDATSVLTSNRVTALSFHVDYWNYLGWTDPFSDPRFSQRQGDLTRASGKKTIYTPEFFVNGEEVRSTQGLTQLMQDTSQLASPWQIHLRASPASGQQLQLDLTLDYSGDEPAGIYHALFENRIVRSIERGENQGRTLTHDYVVKYLSPLHTLSVKKQQSLTFYVDLPESSNPDNLGVAVFIVDGLLRPLQSVAGRLDPAH